MKTEHFFQFNFENVDSFRKIILDSFFVLKIWQLLEKFINTKKIENFEQNLKNSKFCKYKMSFEILENSIIFDNFRGQVILENSENFEKIFEKNYC